MRKGKRTGTTRYEFTTIDSYLKTVLASWPAVVLLIGLFLLTRHRDAIDHFIKNRMTGIGPSGVRADVIEASASTGEIQKKNVDDVTLEDEMAAEQKPLTEVRIEDGVNKPIPGTVRSEVYERYQKHAQIEDRMQTILISKFPEFYRPHVKLTLPSGKSLILDGLFTASNGSLRAIEIKYIEKEKYANLKYSLRGLRDRLEYFGIKKMTAMIIADDLTQKDAVEINHSINLRVKKFFFSLKDGELMEISVPKNGTLLTSPP